MQLHWSPKSPFVRKVMICAHELGLTEKLVLKRSVAAMLKPNEDIMRDNPLSKIPTLVLDDGSALFDSVVICEYLDDLAGGGRLFPADAPRKWQTLRWHALGNGLLDQLILWRNEREREAPLHNLMAAFELKTRKALAVLEREAAELASAPLSIGQVGVGCALGYLDYRFAALNWREQASGLAEWYGTLCERPSFIHTEPKDDTP